MTIYRESRSSWLADTNILACNSHDACSFNLIGIQNKDLSWTNLITLLDFFLKKSLFCIAQCITNDRLLSITKTQRDTLCLRQKRLLSFHLFFFTSFYILKSLSILSYFWTEVTAHFFVLNAGFVLWLTLLFQVIFAYSLYTQPFVSSTIQHNVKHI